MIAKGHTQRVVGLNQILKKELIPFTCQMASMLNAGISVLVAIYTLEEQCEHPGFKVVLKSLRESIESGAPVSDGLRKLSLIHISEPTRPY